MTLISQNVVCNGVMQNVSVMDVVIGFEFGNFVIIKVVGFCGNCLQSVILFNMALGEPQNPYSVLICLTGIELNNKLVEPNAEPFILDQLGLLQLF